MVGLIARDYHERDKEVWDAFVSSSKNAPFLFQRGYMDYHADRFPDASLLIFDSDGGLRALFPATRSGTEVVSHAGLTFGGLLTDRRMTVSMMIELFDVCLQHLAEAGARAVIYKTVPHIYHRNPAEEDLYALFLRGAELCRRDVLTVVDYQSEIPLEERRRRGAAKAARMGIQVREHDRYDLFWQVLAGNLDRRYGVRPVHTLDEIELLAGRFPERIRLFGAFHGDSLLAGAVTYVSDTVCHVQYNATTDDGRAMGAGDLLFRRLIDTFRGQVRYFDFGISTERDGRFLNAGLVEFKQGFGARAVTHDFYRIVLHG